MTKTVTKADKVLSKLTAPELGFLYPFAQIKCSPYVLYCSQSPSNEHIPVSASVDTKYP